MSLDFYYTPMSSPCRAVMLVIEAIGLTPNYKLIDLFVGEHQTPEYEQINFYQTVPFIVDDDYKLSESRAIVCYLVDQHADNSTLYSTNVNTRALINQRLQFDAGTLYKAVASYYYPVAFKGADAYDETSYEKLKDAFAVLDKLLEPHDYAIGRNLTIADLCLIATVTTAQAFGFDIEEYKNVSKWSEKVKSSAPGYGTAIEEPIEKLKAMIFNKNNSENEDEEDVVEADE